ncbi:MAG: division/cell wall cluster transcriptional repressor MraZ [bacterium]
MGEFKHSLDKKNRLFIPSNFRKKSFQQRFKSFILTRGLDGCLYLYDPKTFINISDKFKNLPVADKMEERAFKRLLLSGATEVVPDSQGRILIPHHLVDHAVLKEEVVILGVWDRIELWEESRWRKYKQYADKTFNNIASKLEI